MAKWFLTGFSLRAGLGALVVLVTRNNFEGAMLYFADLPTTFVLWIVEFIGSTAAVRHATGQHPYYLQLNLLGSILWGGLFLLIPFFRRVLRKRG